MLKNLSSRSPLSRRLLVLVGATVILPMAIAFAAQAPRPGNQPKPIDGPASDHPSVEPGR